MKIKSLLVLVLIASLSCANAAPHARRVHHHRDGFVHQGRSPVEVEAFVPSLAPNPAGAVQIPDQLQFAGGLFPALSNLYVYQATHAGSFTFHATQDGSWFVDVLENGATTYPILDQYNNVTVNILSAGPVYFQRTL